MTTSITQTKLREMKLLFMAESLGRRLTRREHEGISTEDFVTLIVDDEYLGRQQNRLARLLKNAAFKYRSTLEEVSYDASRGLKKSMLMEFTQPRWLEKRQGIILTGATGVGKTFLACAIGHEACRMGYSACYYRTPVLLQKIIEMRGTGGYLRFMERLQKTHVLILDDFGIKPFSQEATEDLMEVVESRDQLGSTVIVTQLPKEKLYKTFSEPTLADAICDRLFQGVIDIKVAGESRRTGRGEPKA